MTEISLNSIFNASESGNHVRCCRTRKTFRPGHELPVGLEMHVHIVPAGTRHCNSDSSHNPSPEPN